MELDVALSYLNGSLLLVETWVSSYYIIPKLGPILSHLKSSVLHISSLCSHVQSVLPKCLTVNINCTDCVANKVPFTIKIYSPLLIESLCGIVPTFLVSLVPIVGISENLGPFWLKLIFKNPVPNSQEVKCNIFSASL